MAQTNTAQKIRTIDMAYIAMFAALIAVCSWLSIPAPVPFTLQTFGIFLAVAVLGGKRGSLAVLVYLLLGAMGAPVFAGFAGGFGVLMGATGGYIIGFLASALLMWLMEQLLGSQSRVLALSALLGLMACYAFGTAWFMVVYARTSGPIGLMAALGKCVIPFLVPDLLKIALALAMHKRLAKAIRLA